MSSATTLLVQYRLPDASAFVAEYADHLSEAGLELQMEEAPAPGTRIELRLTHPDGGSVVERIGHVGEGGAGRVVVVFEPSDEETAADYRALLEELVTRDIQTEDLIYAPRHRD